MMAWVLTIAILFVLCRLTRNKSAMVPDVCPDCCLCDCAEKGCGYLRHYELTDAGVDMLTAEQCNGCGTWAPVGEALVHLPGCSVHRS